MAFGIYLTLSKDNCSLQFSRGRAVATALIDCALAVGTVAVGALILLGTLPLGHTAAWISFGVGGALMIEVLVCCYIAYKRKNAHGDDNPLQNLEPPENFADAVEACENPKMDGNIHGVYIFTNELPLSDQEIEILKAYKKGTGLSNRCHVGCGAFYNFDIMCMRKSTYGLIFDFNRNNKPFIEISLSLMQQLNTREEFVTQLIEVIRPNIDRYNHYEGYDDPITRLKAELHRKESWLGSDDNYLYIKGLAEKKQIRAITQDINHAADFQKMVSNLESLGIEIDSLYLSNIYTYVERENFYNFLSALTGASPIILHCHRELHDLGIPPEERRLKQYIGNKWQKVAGDQLVDVSMEIPRYYTEPVRTKNDLLELKNWTVRPIVDGHLHFDVHKLFCQKKGQLERLDDKGIYRKFSQGEIIENVQLLKLNMVVKGFLVISKKDPKRKILIDVGCGNEFKGKGNHAGHLIDALPEGITPDLITDVLITHTHGDHVGGLLSESKTNLYPNARVYVSQAAATNDPFISKYSNVYKFNDQEDLFEGIKVYEAKGHSDDHAVFLIDSELLIVGDMVHHSSIQFNNPEIAISFDSNGQQAIDTRLKLLAMAYDKKWILGGPHLEGFVKIAPAAP